MRIRLFYSFVPFLIVLILSNTAAEAGKIVSESRAVRDFDRLSLSGSGKVFIEQSNRESLRIEADEEIINDIKSEIRNGTLYLGIKSTNFWKKIHIKQPVKYYVTVKTLRSVNVSGSGSVEVSSIETTSLDIDISGSGVAWFETLDADALEVYISGSGDCEINGEIYEQRIIISGSGDYHASDLESENVSVKISGSGKASVRAKEKLDVTISGSGSVNYIGRPVINQRISGSGKVINKGNIAY